MSLPDQIDRNQRTFEYLNNRIHTRETSTLMFTTVAVSASLLLLGILIGIENPFNMLTSLYSILMDVTSPNMSLSIMYLFYEFFQNLNSWLFWFGILIVSLGIIYREITIFFADKKDYKDLNSLLRMARPTTPPPISTCIKIKNFLKGAELINFCKTIKTNPKECLNLRGIIVRIFFFSTLYAWWHYKGYQIFEYPLLNVLHCFISVYQWLYNLSAIFFTGILVIPILLTCAEYHYTRKNNN